MLLFLFELSSLQNTKESICITISTEIVPPLILKCTVWVVRIGMRDVVCEMSPQDSYMLWFAIENTQTSILLVLPPVYAPHGCFVHVHTYLGLIGNVWERLLYLTLLMAAVWLFILVTLCGGRWHTIFKETTPRMSITVTYTHFLQNWICTTSIWG